MGYFIERYLHIKFQNIIKNNYNERCAISGLKILDLLVGCHIKHDIDEDCELDPNNGIYLNITAAKAFTEGLIGFDADYKIYVSETLKSHKFEGGYSQYFGRYEGCKLQINDIIVKPDPQYLQWHMDTIFKRID